MIKTQQTMRAWIQENKKTLQVWLVLILISLSLVALQQPQKASIIKKNIDTYIPHGLVLLPVELSNKASLDGLLQSKGVVDLYTSNPQHKLTKKVAHAVKIIRSPNNPEHFAVLVPEKEASFLIERSPAFYAVIQNPDTQGSFIRPHPKKTKRSITIELDTKDFF